MLNFDNCEAEEIIFSHTWTIPNFPTVVKSTIGKWIQGPDFGFSTRGTNQNFRLKLLNPDEKKIFFFIQNCGRLMTTVSPMGMSLLIDKLDPGFIAIFQTNAAITLKPGEAIQMCRLNWPTQANITAGKMHITLKLKSNDPTLSISHGNDDYPTCSALQRDLKTALEFSNCYDWMLICEEKQLPCHRVILSARSPVFAAAISNFAECAKKEMEIKGLDFDTLEAMVKYLYTGEVDHSKVVLIELFRASDMYDIQELRSECEKLLAKELSVENCVDYLKLSLMHGAIRLTKSARNFIQMHFKDVEQTEGWICRREGAKLDLNEVVEMIIDIV